MYASILVFAVIVIASLLLVHYKPAAAVETFAVAAVNPVLMPACVERSVDAQKLLARLAVYPVGHEGAAEMRWRPILPLPQQAPIVLCPCSTVLATIWNPLPHW